MATNHTEHCQLSQWEPGDQVLRTDFNADHKKIDANFDFNALKDANYVIDCIDDLEGKVLSYIDARNGNVFGAIYENGLSILPDSFITLTMLKENDYDVEVKNGEYKVNPNLVIKLAKEVSEPLLLVPNYLRDTEAERNLHA